jgi:NitT/TauT family transport system substrate-binding protein
MKRRTVAAPAAAVAVAVALLSGGCARDGGTPSPSSVEKRDLTVAAVPVADSAALYIAEQRGLFRAVGLNVKIVPVVSGATAIAGQLAGEYDVVLGNYVSYILADARHNDTFRVLAPGSADSPEDSMILAAPGSSIDSVAGLKGKTIGINAAKNIGTLLVTSVLYDNAVYIKKEHIRFKDIPFPEMTQALQKHEIAAAWMVEPFVTYAELAGAQPIADTDAGATQDIPIAGYMATQSWEQKYPKTAAAFRRALLEGQEIAATSLSAVWRGVETFAGIPASAAVLIALPSYPLTIQPGSLQRIVNLMLSFGMLAHGFDTGQMVH